MSSIRDLALRFPVPPGPASTGCRIIDHEFESKVSVNDFLKEQWKLQPLSDPKMHIISKYPPILTTIEPKTDPERQASFPGDEREAWKDSQAIDQGSSKTKTQKLHSRDHDSAASSTYGAASDQTIVQTPATTPPNNGRPIMNFRPSLWRHLDRSRDKLSLNVFWPKKLSDLQDDDVVDDEAHMFPYEAMKPLLTFRSLKSLNLGGMERSYQRLIWHTVFVNPDLQSLTLETALRPDIIASALPKCIEVTAEYIFPLPIPGWASTTYLGHDGSGTLHDSVGCGEYLDRRAMELACVDAFGQAGGHMLRLAKLVLMGFVVDAAPFFRWFDAQRLRTVVLKDHCFDAGFVLPPAMRGRTEVLLGGGLVKREGARACGPGEAKIVTLRKGEVVDEEAVEVVQRPAQGGQLKKKFSGILRKWQVKDKEGVGEDRKEVPLSRKK